MLQIGMVIRLLLIVFFCGFQMALLTPIVLKGDNLGERHKHLNKLVTDTFENNLDFEKIITSPEKLVIDRLFRIDLASKHRNVEFLINSLKDEDLLYVSRVLKSKWLLLEQYSVLINPINLEENVYPTMSPSGVAKMKQWIYVNLQHENRCEEFYNYYRSKNNYEWAQKFLPNCSKLLIEMEFINYLNKITPQYLKRICEKCPNAIDIYFQAMVANNTNELTLNYLKNEKNFTKLILSLLRSNPCIILDIVEKYYNIRINNAKFTPHATKFIMKNQINRFMAKQELYAVYLLHLPTVAKFLNSEQNKNLIIKLSQSKVLKTWFNYKNIECVMKCINKDDVPDFKRKVFVKKEFGDAINELSYELPSSPKIKEVKHIFSDCNEIEPIFPMIRKKKKFGRNYCTEQAFMCGAVKRMSKRKAIIKPITLLDKLFDKYRFSTFPKVFLELKNQLQLESSHQNRMMMLNVLVSKSSSNKQFVETLLKFCVERHLNEPSTLRAAVLRSLVKRSQIWRLSDEAWSLVTRFGHGIGVDRNAESVDAPCLELIHAHIIRDATNDNTTPTLIMDLYFDNFSPLDNYDLTKYEKKSVYEYLYNNLNRRVKVKFDERKIDEANRVIWLLINVLESYKVDVKKCVEFFEMVILLHKYDKTGSESIIRHIYQWKTCRRILELENFSVIQNDEIYLKTLKHNAHLLKENKNILELAEKGELKHDRFFLKISIYFSEDLAEEYRSILENKLLAMEKINSKLIKSVCILNGSNIFTTLKRIDEKAQQRLSMYFRHSIHFVRPQVKVTAENFEILGAFATKNLLRNSKQSDIREFLEITKNTKNRSFFKLYLSYLIKNLDTQNLYNIFSNATKFRNTILYYALVYLKSQKKAELFIWESIKKLIVNYNIQPNSKLEDNLFNINEIPDNIRLDYCITIYRKEMLNYKVNNYSVFNYLKNNYKKLDGSCLTDFFEDFIKKDFSKPELQRIIISPLFHDRHLLHFKMLAQFLLLCKSEREQNERFGTAEQFFDKLSNYWTLTEQTKTGSKLDMFLKFLKSLINHNIYFEMDYICLLPLYKKVAVYLQKHFPLDKYFKIYCKLHFIILYYKSIKQSVKNCPDVFNNEEPRRKEGVEIVGITLGRYLAYEADELVHKYFNSIIEMYGNEISSFICDIFVNCESREHLFVAILKGLVNDNSNFNACLLATYALKESAKIGCNIKVIKPVYNALKLINFKEVQFILHHFNSRGTFD